MDKATIFLPDAPLLPLFESIRHTAPDFDFKQHAFISKRGELKKLLSWTMGDLIRDFRIDLEVASGGTLLLRRWEPVYLREAGEEAFPGMRVPHYRTNFELETCYPVEGNELAIGHARIVSYVSGSVGLMHPGETERSGTAQDLCGLSLLVQFDVDGFQLQDDSEESAVEVMGPKKKQITSRKSSVLGSESSHTHDSKRILQVLPYDGYEASHEALLELRTRSSKSNFPVQREDMYKHSVWSSTPTTVVALHAFGTFEREEVYDFADLEECAGGEAVQEGVWKVGQLLKGLIQELKSKPVGSKYALVCALPFERSLVLKEGGCGSGLVENSGA